MNDWVIHIGDKNKVFYCALMSLKTEKHQKECFDHLLNYLNQLVTEQKPENWVFNYIFNIKGKGNRRNYIKANILAAKTSLKRILENESFSPFQNRVIIEFLIDFVCDMKYVIPELDEDQDFSWLLINTNCTSSYYFHDAVGWVLYGIGEKDISLDARFNIAVFLIRHTIEQKIKNIIGLQYIKFKDRPVPFAKILSAIKKCSHLIKRNEIDFTRIETINKWANNYLHLGLRPYPWQIEWAEFEIKKLFFHGKTKDNKTWSIYAAFETDDLDKLRKEFKSKIKKQYKESDEVEFRWHSNTEIINNAKK